jgi:serine protease Do
MLVGFATAASGQNVPVATTSPDVNLRRTVTVDVVRRTKDAVVYISTTKLVRTSPFGNDIFFRDFGQNVAVQSLGSGFVVHEDGYIITNNHVIDRAREITVELPDNQKFPAELISTDAEADLAILKIKADKPLPYLELGDSSDLMIGEPVIAVGNPLGYSHSVSTGIVSAVHRNIEDPNVKLTDLIQTDAAINPGNSGGPLLNAYGQVIGINTAVRGDAQNIGFAIQVNRLRDLIPTLMDPAHVNKVQVPIALKESRSVAPPSKVTATVHLADGPQRTAVISINKHRPRDIIDAYVQLLHAKAETRVELEFSKDPPLGVWAKAVAPPDAIVQAKKRLGITIEPLTPMLAQKYGLDIENGMIVSEVQNGSVAAKSGLEPGDIILGMGQYRIQTLDDFGQLLQALPQRGRVPMLVRRGNQQGYLSLQFGAPSPAPGQDERS